MLRLRLGDLQSSLGRSFLQDSRVVQETPTEIFVSFGPVSPHLVFETLAYTIGFALYRSMRARSTDFLPDASRWTSIVAAALGAAAGSKLLALVSEPSMWSERLASPIAYMASGKTIVGGLLGGWLAVELVKRFQGIHERTGDLYALPLCIGIAIGRIGCFLTGLPDRTYGVATSVPWAIDFGDGTPRHPTQLYEIVFLLILALTVRRLPEQRERGSNFRRFLAGYFGWRLAIDFLKPGDRFVGMTGIQWACFAAISWLTWERVRRR